MHVLYLSAIFTSQRCCEDKMATQSTQVWNSFEASQNTTENWIGRSVAIQSASIARSVGKMSCRPQELFSVLQSHRGYTHIRVHTKAHTSDRFAIKSNRNRVGSLESFSQCSWTVLFILTRPSINIRCLALCFELVSSTVSFICFSHLLWSWTWRFPRHRLMCILFLQQSSPETLGIFYGELVCPGSPTSPLSSSDAKNVCKCGFDFNEQEFVASNRNIWHHILWAGIYDKEFMRTHDAYSSRTRECKN